MNILKLSKKTLIYTLGFLGEKDLKNCLLTCKRFRECTYQHLGKTLFRNLREREIKEVLNEAYCDLTEDYPIQIGLRVEAFYSLATLLKLFDHENEKKVQISEIKLCKQSLLQERLRSITNIFSPKEEIEKLTKFASFQVYRFKELFEKMKKDLKMITLPILSLEELDHLLEFEKNFPIPARISVEISDINNTLDQWKSKLQNLPSEIKLCGLSFWRDIHELIPNREKIEEMCAYFQVESLSLNNCLQLDLSTCNSLLKLKVAGADCSHVNLILPKQLRTLKIRVYNWKGSGIDASRCSNLIRCMIYKPEKSGKIILPKSLQKDLSLYDWDVVWKEKHRDNGKTWKITWI